MNSALTKPQSLQELYQRYFAFANRCQFTSLLRNYIQNEEWKDTSQEKVWSMLSKISDSIGSMLTDEVVNYIRNVVDINTCKVPEMIEHAKMLSYSLEHLRNSYVFFPIRIQCLVDIFSINPEYLLGNHQNHILSDEVIKEILIYIRENTKDRTPFTNDNFLDRLLDDPHGLTNMEVYKKFVQTVFYQSIVDALSAKYSDDDGQPIVFNILWKEMDDQRNVLARIDEYRTWVDKFIWNEVEHPLNEPGLADTLFDRIETIKNQKKISTRFNPFNVADHIYFHGLNPNHALSNDELSLVELVVNYHSKPKYDYRNQRFVDDISTQYAYYRELEFCEYVKLVMFVMNNLKSFNMEGLTYDIYSNKFIQIGQPANCLRAVNIFNEGDCVVRNDDGTVSINRAVVWRVAKFLCDYCFHIQEIRENIKTIAHKHAMRGTGALLVHIVNDYLIKELPFIRDMMEENMGDEASELKFGWETDTQFRNYGNVKVLEYEDDNEYFNIEPVADVTMTSGTNERYWEQLEGMSMDDSIGVFTKAQIRSFYKDILGVGDPGSSDQNDVQNYLTGLFKLGANPLKWDSSSGTVYNPIDDISVSETDYGYSKDERYGVQTNQQLRKSQIRQFKEYSGNEDLIGDGMYDLVNNRIFYWKNTDYSSHMLHPFMYNLKLWNRLNNIIINGYRDYVNSDLIEFLTSKTKFDQLFGEYGECRNFWKYNVMDLTGYTTRYEAAIKDEHKDDFNNTTSELTGYDGLFYPTAAREFLELCNDGQDYEIPSGFFEGTLGRTGFRRGSQEFMAAIYSIYWMEQDSKFVGDVDQTSFYTKWYSHLNYTKNEYQKIAMQLWYWRDRIVELIRTEYPITKYCLDIQGNSLILVSTFTEAELDSNPYLIDLTIAQNKIDSGEVGNKNRYSLFCDNPLRRPNELWIRWKSNPIALPAFDVYYDEKVGDRRFDLRYRTSTYQEMGQMTHTNNDCNENFKVVLVKWRDAYREMVAGNKLPVFFDMEQSANVVSLASWTLTPKASDDGIVELDMDGNPVNLVSCAKNPLHILSIERVGVEPSEYNFEEYSSNSLVNGNETLQKWLFDAYQYCQADGSILIPLYRLDCQDTVVDELGESRAQPGDAGFSQKVGVRMFSIPAQTLKLQNYAANQQVIKFDDLEVDLNETMDFRGNLGKYRFDSPIEVCRNTNFVFATYSENGMNKVKCAFLGTFVQCQEDDSSYKVGTCGAETRYEFDSKSAKELAQLKRRYYKGRERDWQMKDGSAVPQGGRKYIDQTIAETGFNSYDSMDKYVFVLDFKPSIDNKRMFDLGVKSKNGIQTYSYNILGDAGYIPHFAYQSLIRFGDKEGGTAYTWKSKYLDTKDHLQFELLGLDNKAIPDLYEAMRKMIVRDDVDKVDTLICPGRFMDDIYRIWCESKGVKRLYFANEFAEYSNPRLDFGKDQSQIEWKAWKTDKTGQVMTDDLFEVELPLDVQDALGGNQEAEDAAFLAVLDDYYVYVTRTDKGELLNEKRYILPPTKLSDFFALDRDGSEYVKCNLNPYQTSLVKDNHFVQCQVVFVGTPNPFNYDLDGSKVYTKAEELQYGNSICGVESIELKLEVESRQDDVYVKEQGGDIKVGEDGKPVKRKATRKWLKPTLKFNKFKNDGRNISLLDRIQNQTFTIPEGEVTVMFSHKNFDNIAKYHILNRSSNLFFDSSLAKNKKNQFKFSDFKFSQTVHVEEYTIETDDGISLTKIRSKEVDENGDPLLDVQTSWIHASKDEDGHDCPPYYIALEEDKPLWFLEQDGLVEVGEVQIENPPTEGKKRGGTAIKKVPGPGKWKWAHKVKGRSVNYIEYIWDKWNVESIESLRTDKTQSYLDYYYIKNGLLAFKVNEESWSFADAMTKVPGFYIDEKLMNKLKDLNDVQALFDFSTFIHQSERPQRVKDCPAFNPLLVDAVIKYGIEQKEITESQGLALFKDNPPRLICTEPRGDKGDMLIELDNIDQKTRIQLQLEDGEIDEHLKIYANYVKVDDGHGDFHFDLYFNIQNLLHSPFEYISSVTNQPNVLILPESYLYLSGAKYIGKDGCNEVDGNKVAAIHKGGTLTLYGQVKVYSDDKLSDVRTIKLFSYQVHNISDDKPKFLIKKTYDITKSTLVNNLETKVKIEFSDVMWTVDESKFKYRDGNGVPYESDKFRILEEPITVVQPLKIRYNWNEEDKYRVNSVSFDIVHDIIDFENTPELLDWYTQSKTLRNRSGSHKSMPLPYYDHWSDKYMKLEFDELTGIPNLTLKYDSDCGFNFETIYLRWLLPSGCRVMDTVDRLGGYVFSSTAQNVHVELADKNATPVFDVVQGHVVPRVKERTKMYLGLEHSTTQRKNGFVITNLADAIRNALLRGESKNPTIDAAIDERDLLDAAADRIING